MSDMRMGADGGTDMPAAEIAGFWRRIFALLIDMILLAAVGFAIGTVAFRQLVALGQEGRLIGAAIALVYYGFLESRWGGGASLGQRLLGLRVVRRDGRTIGLFRSLLRTIVFWMPYYLNGIFFVSVRIPGVPPSAALDSAAGAADIAIVFGGFVLIAYFYIFNRRTRQSLHDLVAGTFVVRVRDDEAPVAAHIWKGHFVIAAVLLVLSLLAPASILGLLTHSSMAASFDRMSALQASLLARPDIATASVQTSVFSSWSTSGPAITRTSLIVNARSRLIPHSMEDEENAIAAIVLRRAPDILGQQYLTVGVSYGYDIGIFSWTYSDNWSGTPQQWQQRMAPRGVTVQS